MRRHIKGNPAVTLCGLKVEAQQWLRDEGSTGIAAQTNLQELQTAEIRAMAAEMRTIKGMLLTLRTDPPDIRVASRHADVGPSRGGVRNWIPPRSTPQQQVCYRCNKPGHLKRECPRERGNMRGGN
jgi:hypothetical protein